MTMSKAVTSILSGATQAAEKLRQDREDWRNLLTTGLSITEARSTLKTMLLAGAPRGAVTHDVDDRMMTPSFTVRRGPQVEATIQVLFMETTGHRDPDNPEVIMRCFRPVVRINFPTLGLTSLAVAIMQLSLYEAMTDLAAEIESFLVSRKIYMITKA